MCGHVLATAPNVTNPAHIRQRPGSLTCLDLADLDSPPQVRIADALETRVADPFADEASLVGLAGALELDRLVGLRIESRRRARRRHGGDRQPSCAERQRHRPVHCLLLSVSPVTEAGWAALPRNGWSSRDRKEFMPGIKISSARNFGCNHA